MEKEKDADRRLSSYVATPVLFLLAFPVICVGLDFFYGSRIPWMQYLTNSENVSSRAIDDHEFMKMHLARLVRGDDRRELNATGFACDRTYHSFVCVSDRPVRIDTGNMTVYVESPADRETLIRPYARQEDELTLITEVNVRQYSINATARPTDCQYIHRVPAVVFSSGSTGNVFHEINEIVIPLFITTKQFQSRVQLVLEDYKPSFMAKYGKAVSLLTAYEVLDPARNRSIHCFPGSIIGLKYHDNLALNSSDIPGGYGMPEFRQFLRQAYTLKFSHVSEIHGRPQLMLLSRTNTRRFLNEDEMIPLMEEIGFQVTIVRRSKLVSNLNKFSQLINSCSVLVGAHGAGLTNQVFLPSGAVMVQVELLGTEWASNTYYGDTAGAMGVNYLRYKINADESSLSKLYGRNNSVVTDPDSVYREKGYRAARTVFLDQQNVRLNLERFRETLIEALSIVTEWSGE